MLTHVLSLRNRLVDGKCLEISVESCQNLHRLAMLTSNSVFLYHYALFCCQLGVCIILSFVCISSSFPVLTNTT